MEILKVVVSGQHIRPLGSDIPKGEVVVRSGSVLSPSHIGVLASIGVPNLQVKRRPTVAVFSTGNEVRLRREKIVSY